MPRETVYGSELPFGTDEVNPGAGRAVAEVTWSREAEHVQVVTKCVEASTEGRLVHDDEGIHYTDGFWVTLDRNGINRLIRNLRRARDQAFGRDE
jgi:hypothetical protein